MKRETVKKFSLEDAFKALDEIEIPKVKGIIADSRVDLTESVRPGDKTEALMEDFYDINNKDDMDMAKAEREDEIAKAKLARIEKIVDLDAKTPEDIQPSYAGKFIIQCPQCMTMFYKDEADIEHSEDDENTVNVGEVCQHCGNETGYMLIGKVAPVAKEEEADYTSEEIPAHEEGGEDKELEVASEEPTEETPAETEEELPADETNGEENAELEPEEETESDEEESDKDKEEKDEEEKKEESFVQPSGEVLTESVDVIDIYDGTGSHTDRENGKTYIEHEDELMQLANANPNKKYRYHTDDDDYKVNMKEIPSNIEVVNESLHESADEDLSKALNKHNQFIEFIQHQIKMHEDALAKADNDEVKEAIQRMIDSLKDDLKNALPDALKDQVEETETELPTPEENDEEAVEASGETEEKKESLHESEDKLYNVASIFNTILDIDTLNTSLVGKCERIKTHTTGKPGYINADMSEYNIKKYLIPACKFIDRSNHTDLVAQLNKIVGVGEKTESLHESNIIDERQKFIDLAGVEVSGTTAKCLFSLYGEEFDKKPREITAEDVMDWVKSDNNDPAEMMFYYKDELLAYSDIPVVQARIMRDLARMSPKMTKFCVDYCDSHDLFSISDEDEETGKEIISTVAHTDDDCIDAVFVVEDSESDPNHVFKMAQTIDDIDKEYHEFKESLNNAKANDVEADTENHSENNTLNEEAIDADVSEADVEELMDSPEFKKPISDSEVQNIIADNKEESFDLDGLEDVKEESLDEHFTAYLKEVYSNVENFTTTNCSIENNNLVVEGKINFKSGKSKNTEFTFAPKTCKANRPVFEGFNKDLAEGKVFTLNCSAKKACLVAESFGYKYSINSNLVEGLK